MKGSHIRGLRLVDMLDYQLVKDEISSDILDIGKPTISLVILFGFKGSSRQNTNIILIKKKKLSQSKGTERNSKRFFGTFISIYENVLDRAWECKPDYDSPFKSKLEGDAFVVCKQNRLTMIGKT